MSGEREKLTNMFSKVMAGTVTREEGTMLINHLAKEDLAATMRELAYLIETPPPGVFPKTILHTIALSRNKAFTNIIISGLDHKNEDVSILAAQELARLKTEEAKEVLAEHLDSEAYHVRKVSASALIEGFSDGVDIVAQRLLARPEDFYRSTYAQALADAGRNGVDALLKVMVSGGHGAVVSAARSLLETSERLTEQDVPRVFEALMAAGDNNDSGAIVEILRLAGTLGGRAKGFEGYVKAFSDHSEPSVRDEARSALEEINA
ncbi:MAG: HEAT repeat domain-containing protein [Thermodesulfobacteriota bacterium]